MAAVLPAGGRIVLIVPAFQALYGPIDGLLGHYRRYSKKSLREVAERAGVIPERLRYMNFVGFFSWWFNSHILKRNRAIGVADPVLRFESRSSSRLSRESHHPAFRPVSFCRPRESFRVTISILIPIYNEFRTLPLVLQRVLQAPLPAGCEREVIVIDDGSTDGTSDLLRAEAAKSPLIHVQHSPVNMGKGSAIRIGLSHASGDIVLIQDGDLEYDPNDYLQILRPIVDGTADVVYGSRFMGKFKGMKRANWLANRILTISANVLYGARLTDEATAYKAFRTEVIRSVRLNCLRFEFCPEVTAKLLRAGHRIHEVPIYYNPRGIAEGKKIRFVDGFEALWTLIRATASLPLELDSEGSTLSDRWKPVYWKNLPNVGGAYYLPHACYRPLCFASGRSRPPCAWRCLPRSFRAPKSTGIRARE